MYRIWIVLILTVLSPHGCKSQSAADHSARAADNESAKAAIIALQQQWEKAFHNRDAAALAKLYTDDCVRMPNGGPTTIGRESLEAAYRREFSDIWRTKFSATIKTDEVVVLGDYAFARGTDTLTQEVNGKTVHESGKWMATYRRHANGPWKYFWSTYNSNH